MHFLSHNSVVFCFFLDQRIVLALELRCWVRCQPEGLRILHRTVVIYSIARAILDIKLHHHCLLALQHFAVLLAVFLVEIKESWISSKRSYHELETKSQTHRMTRAHGHRSGQLGDFVPQCFEMLLNSLVFNADEKTCCDAILVLILERAGIVVEDASRVIDYFLG